MSTIRKAVAVLATLGSLVLLTAGCGLTHHSASGTATSLPAATASAVPPTAAPSTAEPDTTVPAPPEPPTPTPESTSTPGIIDTPYRAAQLTAVTESNDSRMASEAVPVKPVPGIGTLFATMAPHGDFDALSFGYRAHDLDVPTKVVARSSAPNGYTLYVLLVCQAHSYFRIGHEEDGWESDLIDPNTVLQPEHGMTKIPAGHTLQPGQAPAYTEPEIQIRHGDVVLTGLTEPSGAVVPATQAEATADTAHVSSASCPN